MENRPTIAELEALLASDADGVSVTINADGSVSCIAPTQWEPPQGEWLDISTAPRSYKPILACDNVRGYVGVVVHNGQEWEAVTFESFPTGTGFYPTHWMPLHNLPPVCTPSDRAA